MKRIVSSLLVVLCALLLVLTITSCGTSGKSETFRVTKPSDRTGYTLNGPDSVVKGQDYEFTVTISEGYLKGTDFRVTVNNEEVTENENKYVVKNVSSDLVIAVEGVVADCGKETVGVTLPKDPVGFTVSGNPTAVKGEKYEFTVQINEGYEAGKDFAVKVNGKIVSGTDGKYTVENVAEDLVIEVTGVEKLPETVSVTFPKDPIGFVVSGESTAVKGGTYEFRVTVSAGYEAGADFAVKVNGTPVSGTDGKYTVENVSEALVIEVIGVSKMAGIATVTFPKDPVGFIVSGDATVTEGATYEFTVGIVAGYEKAKDFAVKVNGKVITETDGKYIVENVTEDLVIEVTGIAKIPGIFTVTFPKDPSGYTVSGDAKVSEGNTYEFTVAIIDGYEKTNDFAVKVNGKVVSETNGKYVVANVTEDLVIEVTGVRKIPETFTVKFPNNPTGYTVKGNAKVTEGSTYEFIVEISEGYEKSDYFAVKVNGKVITETNGKYIVANVTENLTITVTGVNRILSYVTVRLPENPIGFTVDGETRAELNGSYEFTVTILPGYRADDSFAVTANGVKLNGDNGKYVIERITSNTVIEVTGVEEITLNAIFSADGFPNALKNGIEHFAYDAANFTFKIELADNYTQCADRIEVYYRTEGAAEVKLTPDEEGVYSIPNPHTDITIIVKNVAKNRYTVKFFRNAVEKYSIEVEAESVLTAEQLNAAKAAVLNQGEVFVAWREDVTTAITNNTIFSAYTTPETAFGELIDGCPLKDGANVPLGSGEYSAAGGFEKVYGKTNAASNIFADIDLSKYSEVRFGMRIDDSWLLFGNWENYVDVHGTWLDVVMTNLFTGKWRVTVTGPINHNGDGPSVLTSFTAEYEGSTLAQILSEWQNDSGVAAISVTELRGVKVLMYGEVIANIPATDFAPSSDRVAPADFNDVYFFLSPTGKKFADVDISKYSEIKFYLLLADGYFLVDGWGAYAENFQLGNNWVPVTLVKDENGNWIVTVAAQLTGSDVTDTGKYTYTASGTTLAAVLNGWFDYCSGAQVYLTEIRGIKLPRYGEVIADVPANDFVKVTDKVAPDGFDDVYYFLDPTGKKFADVDITKFGEVKFYFSLTDGYCLINGWGAYAENMNLGKGWVPVTLVNNGDGTWTITVTAKLSGENVTDTSKYTYTTSGSTLAEVLNGWFDYCSGAQVYLTEIRGLS